MDASYTQRFKGPHAITIKYLGNRRDATLPDLGSRTQRRGTTGIFTRYWGRTDLVMLTGADDTVIATIASERSPIAL